MYYLDNTDAETKRKPPPEEAVFLERAAKKRKPVFRMKRAPILGIDPVIREAIPPKRSVIRALGEKPEMRRGRRRPSREGPDGLAESPDLDAGDDGAADHRLHSRLFSPPGVLSSTAP